MRLRNRNPPEQSGSSNDRLFSPRTPSTLGKKCIGITEDSEGSPLVREGESVTTFCCVLGKAVNGAHAEYTR